MGRGESKANASTTLPTAQKKKLDSIANRTRNYKNEQYRIVDNKGNVILEKRGGAHEVGATVGEKRDAFWNNEDAVSIHNHPNGGTFSPEDLSEFGYGAKAMVVASPEATYTLAINKSVAKQKGKGWLAMRDAYEKATGHNEFRGLEYRKKLQAEAHKNPKIAKADKQTQALAERWIEARNAGQTAKAEKIFRQYNRLNDAVRKAVDVEMRKLEVKPYDDFLRKNAKKYGFTYIVNRK